MPRFFYTVRDSNGQKNSGVEEGFNQEDAVNKLQARGFLVVSIIPEAKDEGLALEKVSGLRLKFKHFGISSEDLMLFCRQLATLLGAGRHHFKKPGYYFSAGFQRQAL